MPSFRFKKENGKVQGREWLWANVKNKMLSLPDGDYIWPHPEKFKRKRSSQQNRYYFGVICKLAGQHCGYDQDEMHQEFGKLFLSYEKNGKQFIKSTTKLNTAEFEGYLEKCRRFAAMDLQCFIPLPNEPNNYYYDPPKRTAA